MHHIHEAPERQLNNPHFQVKSHSLSRHDHSLCKIVGREINLEKVRFVRNREKEREREVAKEMRGRSSRRDEEEAAKEMKDGHGLLLQQIHDPAGWICTHCNLFSAGPALRTSEMAMDGSPCMK